MSMIGFSYGHYRALLWASQGSVTSSISLERTHLEREVRKSQDGCGDNGCETRVGEQLYVRCRRDKTGCEPKRLFNLIGNPKPQPKPYLDP